MGQPVYDGNLSFLGGQNAGLNPSLLQEGQYFTAINTTVKNGSLRPRPGYTEYPIKVLTPGGITMRNGAVRSYADIYRTGKFQGAGQLISDQGKFIVATISGVIFRINPFNGTAIVLPIIPQKGEFEPVTQRLNQYTDRHNWTQAGKYYVIADYPDYPIIIEGIAARRADPAKYEVPIPAVLFAYNQNRLFAFSISHEFTGGDPVGNRATPNAPITFEEVFAPASAYLGQIFSLGSTSLNNPITAAGYLEAVDSNTGIGPMFVATSEYMYAYQTQLERSQWGNTTFGVRILSTSGVAGQRAFTNVGSDIWFMSGDGRIRSFSVARGDQAKWARTPLDKEVQNWIRFCDRELIKYTTSIHHNNRILFTVNPQLTTSRDLENNKVLDVSFQGMVALELDPVSGFMQVGNPSWAGLWTGINVMELVELEHEAYAFSKDTGNINVLYRLELDDITWDTSKGKRKQIVSRIETRSYAFQQQGLLYALKEEVTVFPGLKDVAGKFCIQLERKNDDFPNYSLWRTFKHDAPIEACIVTPDGIPNLVKHNFRELNFGDPLDTNTFCNPINKEDMRYFNETQFRITITGLDWELTSFRVKAELQEDDMLITTKLCETESILLEQKCEDVSDFNLYSTALKEGVWECRQTEC